MLLKTRLRPLSQFLKMGYDVFMHKLKMEDLKKQIVTGY